MKADRRVSDDHRDPCVKVSKDLLADLFFIDDRSKRLGLLVSLWLHAIWKRSPRWIGSLESHPDILADAITYGWVVVDDDGMRLTGPDRDPRWLLDIDIGPRRVSTYALASDSGAVKIGRSSNVSSRVSALQTSSPHKLTLLGTRLGDFEKKVHALLAVHRLSGEWFALNDSTLDILVEQKLARRH